MTTYSSPELEARANNIVALLQAKLVGAGIKSELANNWYWFTLIVTEDPEVYRAATVSEGTDKGTLVVTFETIRMEPDGEILYRGPTMEEGLENFEQELYDEAIKQNNWVKRMHERRAANHQLELDSMRVWADLRREFPGYEKDIQRTSIDPLLFSLNLKGLTQDRLREILRLLGGSNA